MGWMVGFGGDGRVDCVERELIFEIQNLNWILKSV